VPTLANAGPDCDPCGGLLKVIAQRKKNTSGLVYYIYIYIYNKYVYIYIYIYIFIYLFKSNENDALLLESTTEPGTEDLITQVAGQVTTNTVRSSSSISFRSGRAIGHLSSISI
jgi:hypothetical protein